MDPSTAFFVGLVVGVAAGVLLKDAWLIVHRKVTTRRSPAPMHTDETHSTRRFYVLLILVLALAGAQVAIGLLALTTKSGLSDQVADFGDFAECQAGFNQAQSEASGPVRDATVARDAALTAYLEYAAGFAGGDRQPTQAEQARGQELFRELLQTSKQLQQTRAQNPLPPPPAQTCGRAP